MDLHYKKLKFLYLFFAVFLLTVSFYFWERYLLNHFLGGYDQYGLPAQQSATGFFFFLAGWPVWSFPLLVIFSSWFFVSNIKNERRREIKSDIASKLVEKELECTQLYQEVRALEAALKSTAGYKDEYADLDKAFCALAKDYKRSLELIEQLLDQSLST